VYASDPAAVNTAAGSVRGASPERTPSASASSFPAVGETPLRRLSRLVAASGGSFELYAKLEFLNPSGSVKDRAAAHIVRTALANGALGNDRTLIDASSGNTAVAYAMLGAQLGFRVELCLPRNAHPERVVRIESFGARVVFTDPLEGTDGAQREARRRAAAEPERYYYPDQYNNPANPEAHYLYTGPEIWRQSEGRVTHFVAGVGTGGTISGTGRFLKERQPRLEVIGVEPSGPMHGLEGLKHLPTAMRPSTYDARVVDRTIRVETEAAQEVRRQIWEEEGLSVGLSAAAAVWASVEVGRASPKAHIVTILPDAGHAATWEAR
jgi:S-sulfo-L-cysteine synthase (O-acetyl-L-serine-dependent)